MPKNGGNTTFFYQKCHFFSFFVVSLNTLHYICEQIQVNISFITINNHFKIKNYEQNRIGREDCSRR